MIEVKTSSEYILDTSKEYSLYVCEHRAIPRVNDGLKDGQRKALWLIKNKADKIKTISLSGELISSNLYLHGDQSASDTISRLAAPFCNNIPLLDGVGAFGTRISPVEGIGAPRYTYVKKGKAAEELLFVDLDIVPTRENYDGSTIEPIHFLPLIPIVLLNGISGIAVGWSTEILPRSFKDLVESTIDILNGKNIKRLIPTYEYLNCSVNHLENNSWEFKGKASIIDGNTIKVTELPPDLNLEKFKERLNTMEDENIINSYIDRSTKVIDITIKMPRGSVKGWSDERVIGFLKLKQKITERIVVIDWNGNNIKQYETAEKLLIDFVVWRLKWFTKRYEFLLTNDLYELSYWQALKCCFDDKLPARIGSKKNKKEVEDDVNLLTKNCSIDSKQLDKIVSLPTYKWAHDFYLTILENIKTLEDNIKLYRSILSDPELIKNIYIKELTNLKKVKFK